MISHMNNRLLETEDPADRARYVEFTMAMRQRMGERGIQRGPRGSPEKTRGLDKALSGAIL